MMQKAAFLSEAICFLFLLSLSEQSEKPPQLSSSSLKASDLAIGATISDPQAANKVSANSKQQIKKKSLDSEDLEYLCHHFYKDEFVVAAEVLEAGCLLECVLLQASGKHGQQFFDTSVTKFHHLNEGLECAARKVSKTANNCFSFHSAVPESSSSCLLNERNRFPSILSSCFVLFFS